MGARACACVAWGFVVRCARNTGIMFLVEVALGEEHHISRDDWTLTKPPSGKDCIIAKGHTEPGRFTATNFLDFHNQSPCR